MVPVLECLVKRVGIMFVCRPDMQRRWQMCGTRSQKKQVGMQKMAAEGRGGCKFCFQLLFFFLFFFFSVDFCRFFMSVYMEFNETFIT